MKINATAAFAAGAVLALSALTGCSVDPGASAIYRNAPGMAPTPATTTVAAPVAAPVTTPAAPTSFTYKVTGNYRATQIDYTGSDGSEVKVNDTSDTRTVGSKLPWSQTVTPEPNGRGQYLNAQEETTKGDAFIDCVIMDNSGRVVDEQRQGGAYPTCIVSTPYTN